MKKIILFFLICTLFLIAVACSNTSINEENSPKVIDSDITMENESMSVENLFSEEELILFESEGIDIGFKDFEIIDFIESGYEAGSINVENYRLTLVIVNKDGYVLEEDISVIRYLNPTSAVRVFSWGSISVTEDRLIITKMDDISVYDLKDFKRLEFNPDLSDIKKGSSYLIGTVFKDDSYIAFFVENDGKDNYLNSLEFNSKGEVIASSKINFKGISNTKNGYTYALIQPEFYSNNYQYFFLPYKFYDFTNKTGDDNILSFNFDYGDERFQSVAYNVKTYEFEEFTYMFKHNLEDGTSYTLKLLGTYNEMYLSKYQSGILIDTVFFEMRDFNLARYIKENTTTLTNPNIEELIDEATGEKNGIKLKFSDINCELNLDFTNKTYDTYYHIPNGTTGELGAVSDSGVYELHYLTAYREDYYTLFVHNKVSGENYYIINGLVEDELSFENSHMVSYHDYIGFFSNDDVYIIDLSNFLIFSNENNYKLSFSLGETMNFGYSEDMASVKLLYAVRREPITEEFIIIYADLTLGESGNYTVAFINKNGEMINSYKIDEETLINSHEDALPVSMYLIKNELFIDFRDENNEITHTGVFNLSTYEYKRQ